MSTGKKIVLGLGATMALTCTFGISAVTTDIKRHTADVISDAAAPLCEQFGAQAVKSGQYGFTYKDVLNFAKPPEDGAAFTVCVQPANGPEISILFPGKNKMDDVVIVGREEGDGRVARHVENWRHEPEAAMQMALGEPVAQTLKNNKTGKYFKPTPNDISATAPLLPGSLLAKLGMYAPK